MSIWRIQSITSKGHIGQYCIDHGIAAVGWSLLELPQSERESIFDFDTYENYAQEYYEHYSSVNRLHSGVHEGDLIWMRNNGRYYIARVEKNSKWYFDASKDASDHDASNAMSNICWYPYEESDESSVPGAISTSFIKGSTFQRICKEGVEQYSQLLYNEIVGKKIYNVQMKLTKENFFSLLTTDDCEDLLSLWLYTKFKYICIPSTCKISTQLYECVLIDPQTGKHIYTQVKDGNVNIDANDYKKLEGDVWFFTTKGNVLNIEGNENMHIVSSDILYEFATMQDSENILSPSIRTWISFLEQNEHRNRQKSSMGIIFDTNKSYDTSAQDYMINNCRVSAWGNAQKYVDRFQLGDYVLYYEKGKGIFSIGITISDNSIIQGNEKYRDVKIIIAPKYGVYLSPKEIKAIVGQNMYFPSTVKLPYLTTLQVEKVIKRLQEKQN